MNNVNNPLLVKEVHGGHVELLTVDDGIYRCQLTFHGYRLDGRPDRLCIVVDRNGAAAILIGLRAMFGEAGELDELERQAAERKIHDKRALGPG